MFPSSNANPSGSARFLLKTTGVALLTLCTATLSLRAGGPVLSPVKGGSAPVAAQAIPLPDNLALGLQEMAADYNAAMTKGAKTLSTAQFSTVASNYPLARTDDQQRVQVEVILDGTAAMSNLVATCQAAGCDITAQIDWYHQGEFSMWMPLRQGRQARPDAGRGQRQAFAQAAPSRGQGSRPGREGAQCPRRPDQLQHPRRGHQGRRAVGQLQRVGTAYPVHAAQDVASGDLPGTGNPEGYTTPVNVLVDLTAELAARTRAAPCSRSSTTWPRPPRPSPRRMSPQRVAANITARRISPPASPQLRGHLRAGCKVICDDVGYL